MSFNENLGKIVQDSKQPQTEEEPLLVRESPLFRRTFFVVMAIAAVMLLSLIYAIAEYEGKTALVKRAVAEEFGEGAVVQIEGVEGTGVVFSRPFNCKSSGHCDVSVLTPNWQLISVSTALLSHEDEQRR